MPTREEFKKVIVDCSINYEETWCDMDVIQPFDSKKPDEMLPYERELFIPWFTAKYPDVSGKVLSLCDKDFVWEFKDIWCILEAMCSFDEIDSVDVFVDYCMENPKFARAVYAKGTRYLNEIGKE